jgi:ABC-type nitrate/sulfonate/bicarbonate transport system permease component
VSSVGHIAARLGQVNYLGFGFVLALLVLWEAAVRLEMIAVFGLPAFSSVLAAFAGAVVSGELLATLVPTLQRWAIGYALAIIVGVSIGMLMGYSRMVYRLLEPITEFIRPIPSPAYVPVAILFLGIGDAMKIFVITLAAVFPTMISTYSGVRSIDSVQMGTAKTFGLPRGATVRHVVLPAAAPYIFTGLRVSLAVSLILTVISEMIAGNSGMGYYILFAQRSFLVPEMYAGIITLGILGYTLNRLFLLIERKLLGWHFAVSGRAAER